MDEQQDEDPIFAPSDRPRFSAKTLVQSQRTLKIQPSIERPFSDFTAFNLWWTAGIGAFRGTLEAGCFRFRAGTERASNITPGGGYKVVGIHDGGTHCLPSVTMGQHAFLSQ